MKLHKILGILAIGVAAVSCNDLEQAPSNKFTDKNYWTSPARAQNVVNMAYNQMYNANWFWTDESLSDNVVDGNRVSEARLMRRGMATPSLGTYSSQWSDIYGGLKTCHVFLDHVSLMNMDETLRSRMIAEIRFVRAFLYFRLTNLYGAVPFFTSDITLEQANTIARTPAEQIRSFIHSELDDIVADLPSKNDLSAADNGKITKGAALMLQARVYLMEGDWDNVIRYCDMLINRQGEFGSYELFNSYAGLFKEENEYNCEVILDRSYVPNLITWGEMADMAPLSVGARLADRVPVQSLVDTYLTVSGYRIDEEGTDYDPRDPYARRDPRLTATVVYDGFRWADNFGSGPQEIRTAPGSGTDDSYSGQGKSQSSSGYYVFKYFAPQAEGNLSSGLNLIMMRYADVLLMYAEAMFEKGLMTADVWNSTIRLIRQRAGLRSAKALNYPSAASEAEMRRTIRDERRVELALEGLRWYDIKRWKAGKEYLDGKVLGANFNGSNIEIDTYKFDETRDYLWAVPQDQINLNKNLAPNNPGYSN